MKSVIVPNRIELIHQHEAIKCFGEKCEQKKVMPNTAWISHYRSKVKRPEEKITVLDHKMLKYREEPIEAVEKALKEIGFTP